MPNKGQSPDTVFRRSVRPVLIGVCFGAGACSVILLLLSVLMTVQSVPQAAIDPMAICALVVGGFTSGFCCARIVRQNGLAYGAVCGGVEAALVVVAGTILQDGSFGIPGVLKVAFVMLAAMLGGVLGVNAKKKRRK